MRCERTFAMIKPNAVSQGHTGEIISMIIEAKFRIVALKMVCMSRNDVQKFYAEHRDAPFFDNLVLFMSSGPIIVMILEGDNAVKSFRKLVGNTDPEKAESDTIRHRFAESITRNAIHAADCNENARNEWSQFFAEHEIMVCDYELPFPAHHVDS